MKWMIFTLFLFVGCGASDQVLNSDQKSELRTFQINQVVTAEDNTRIQDICNALKGKNDNLFDIAARSQVFTFAYSQKNCSDTDFSPVKDVPSRLTNAGNYFFTPLTLDTFAFSQVDTHTAGVMAEICKAQGSNLSNPYRDPSNVTAPALWFTTASTKFCQEDFNHRCILIETGTSLNTIGDSYRITKREWVKFNTSSTTMKGFFTSRRYQSFSGCPEGQRLEIVANLK